MKAASLAALLYGVAVFLMLTLPAEVATFLYNFVVAPTIKTPTLPYLLVAQGMGIVVIAYLSVLALFFGGVATLASLTTHKKRSPRRAFR